MSETGYLLVCSEPDCDWVGTLEETVQEVLAFESPLCPECHAVVVIVKTEE